MEPLTIKNFNASDSFISDPYLGNYGLTLAKFVNIEGLPLIRIDGEFKSLPPIRVDGEFKVYK